MMTGSIEVCHLLSFVHVHLYVHACCLPKQSILLQARLEKGNLLPQSRKEYIFYVFYEYYFWDNKVH